MYARAHTHTHTHTHTHLIIITSNGMDCSPKECPALLYYSSNIVPVCVQSAELQMLVSSDESGPANVLDDGTVHELVLSHHLHQVHPVLTQLLQALLPGLHVMDK